MWEVYETSDRHIHVVPEDDLVSHEYDVTCPCGPSVEAVEDERDGNISLLVVHYSLDGREDDE
jgi:hypothetical protein